MSNPPAHTPSGMPDDTLQPVEGPRRRRRGPWLAIAAIVAVLAIVAAVVIVVKPSGLRGVASSVTSETSYTVGLHDQPSSLDIRTNSERAVSQALIGNVYETLLTHDTVSGGDGGRKVQGGLVATWSQTEDGLSYTFHLRDGLTFSDGSTLDASSVVASLQAIVKGKYVGYESLGDIAKVSNSDERTFTIALHKTNPSLPEALTGRAGIVYNTKAKDPDYATHAYGSGPFTVKAVAAHSITLERSRHYWGTPAKAKQITLQYYEDEDAMVHAVKDGTLDAAVTLTPRIAAELGKYDSLTVTDGISVRKTLVAFNCGQDSPFSDEQVRKLTRYAIDAAGIAKSTPAAEAQLSGPIQQLEPGYTDLDGLFPYDAAKAASMRAFFPANYFQAFTLLADSDHQDVAQKVVDQMAAAGLPVTLETVDTATLDARVAKGDYTAALVESSDPYDYVDYVNGSARFNYQNGQAQEAYRHAREATNMTEWEKRLQAFDRIVSEDAASAWLYTNKVWVIKGKQLSGLPTALLSQRLELANLSS
ncbi:MAG: ABC transporter substrate-binding protein [Bifidobacterium sp.]|nr:ABC transporter substrate-binding protein [Bifidobacterium sp.]